MWHWHSIPIATGFNPAALFPLQLLANEPGTGAEHGPGTKVPATYVRDSGNSELMVCSHLGSVLVDGRSLLSVSPSP